jgi:hypothetical protein
MRDSVRLCARKGSASFVLGGQGEWLASRRRTTIGSELELKDGMKTYA